MAAIVFNVHKTVIVFIKQTATKEVCLGLEVEISLANNLKTF